MALSMGLCGAQGPEKEGSTYTTETLAWEMLLQE